MTALNPKLSAVNEIWARNMEADARAGVVEVPVRYRDYQGVSIGHFVFMQGTRGMIFECKGAVATDVAAELIALGVEINPKRLDFRVDVEETTPLEAVYLAQRERIREAEAARGERFPTQLVLTDNPAAGSSMACGKRGKAKMHRDYDKTAESHGTSGPNVRRQESEVAGKLAPKVWEQMAKEKDLNRFALGVVKRHREMIGAPASYDQTAPPYEFPSAYEPTSEEKTAAWLINIAAKAFKKIRSETLRHRVAVAFGLGYEPLPESERPQLSDAAREAFRSLHAQREASRWSADVYPDDGTDEDERGPALGVDYRIDNARRIFGSDELEPFGPDSATAAKTKKGR
jgi:hypothetical protein